MQISLWHEEGGGRRSGGGNSAQICNWTRVSRNKMLLIPTHSDGCQLICICKFLLKTKIAAAPVLLSMECFFLKRRKIYRFFYFAYRCCPQRSFITKDDLHARGNPANFLAKWFTDASNRPFSLFQFKVLRKSSVSDWFTVRFNAKSIWINCWLIVSWSNISLKMETIECVKWWRQLSVLNVRRSEKKREWKKRLWYIWTSSETLEHFNLPLSHSLHGHYSFEKKNACCRVLCICLRELLLGSFL